jgi:hypothetical protein
LENVFDLLGVVVKINKIRALRFKSEVNASVVTLCARLLGIFVRWDSDLAITRASVEQCLETISWYLLAVAAYRIPDSIRFGENLLEFVSAVVKKFVPQSIEIIDNRHIVSEDDEEDLASVPMCLMDILQLVASLPASGPVKAAVAEATVSGLACLSETNITASVACAITETMFVVFGEADQDAILATTDWVARLSSIAVFVNSRLATKKLVRNERSQYFQGTVENIKAFVQYKRGSS